MYRAACSSPVFFFFFNAGWLVLSINCLHLLLLAWFCTWWEWHYSHCSIVALCCFVAILGDRCMSCVCYLFFLSYTLWQTWAWSEYGKRPLLLWFLSFVGHKAASLVKHAIEDKTKKWQPVLCTWMRHTNEIVVVPLHRAGVFKVSPVAPW